MNRTAQYTLVTSKWIDFLQPIGGQMSKISATVISKDPLHLEKARNDRKEPLRIVKCSDDKNKARYNYTLYAESDFLASAFGVGDKPLLLRHVKSITVAKVSGTGAEVDTEVEKINEVLKPLNDFFATVKSVSGKKRDVENWTQLLNKKLEEINKKAKTEGLTKIKERNVVNQNELEELKEALKQGPSEKMLALEKFFKIFKANIISLCKMVFVVLDAWLLWLIKENMSVVMAIIKHMTGAPLREIAESLLSDEGFSPEELASYVQQYLDHAARRPEQINADSLMRRVYKDSLIIYSIAACAITMILLVQLMFKACRR